MDSKEETLGQLIERIINGEKDLARQAAEDSLAVGLDALEAIQQGTSKAMKVVGRRFAAFEIFLPELIMAAEAANAAMAVLLPNVSADRREEALTGRVVIGTVSGDLHDIGKNLVSAVLSSAGFEVHDLGVDVPSKKFADAVQDVKADIVAISSLLTTSMQCQKDVIDYMTDMGLRDKCFVIVGGGPVTPTWAAQIGSDGYGRRATDAAEVCSLLMQGDQKPPLSQPVIVGDLDD